jgi:hypothetical protein
MSQLLPATVLAALIEEMQQCPQTSTQNVYEHGASVWRYTHELLQHLRTGTPLGAHWSLPSWVSAYASPLLVALPSDETLEGYATFHDCGKPRCRVAPLDGGPSSFPDHANVSANTWRALGGSEEIAALMALDMEIHTIKGDQVPAFAALAQAPALLLVGLAEVHSNAAMFGGVTSQSFKIKLAQLERRGKAACKLLFPLARAA